jgi:acetolactate synthase-1/2/3 large subunit
MDFEKKIVCDSGLFISRLLEKARKGSGAECADWIAYCVRAKKRFPIVHERQAVLPLKTDMYAFGRALSRISQPTDVVVAPSSGRSCGVLNLSFERVEGQAMIGSMALGSMGFALPAAIGACIASGKRRTIVLEGDGSLQHNVQELMLISNYKLPIKLFVMNNGGYASIVTMQKNHFKGRLVACNENTGIKMPNLEGLARLYGLDYYVIRGDSDVEKVLHITMSDDRPVLCEVLADDTFDEIPKAVSRVAADGSISSSSLEDLFPFLPEEETDQWMREARGQA